MNIPLPKEEGLHLLFKSGKEIMPTYTHRCKLWCTPKIVGIRIIPFGLQNRAAWAMLQYITGDLTDKISLAHNGGLLERGNPPAPQSV
jgi:hypothetical protein